MQRFRAISLTLLTLATLILAVEAYRTPAFYPRVALIAILSLFGLLGLRLSAALSPEHRTN